MELGNQIKALRLQRGVTQEALAQHLNVSSQAVSKWEREAAMPDVQLLPAISAYFGVTIDALFALSDDTRMERIQMKHCGMKVNEDSQNSLLCCRIPPRGQVWTQ